jgi:hypothetical protein
LGTSSIGCVVDIVACGISGGIGWRVVGGSVGSGVDRLYHFVFTSFLFNHKLKGAIATTLLVKMFCPASGVRACNRSAVSRASFFDLSGDNADMCLKTPYCRSVLKLTKGGTQVCLRGVVDLMTVLLKVP